MDERLKVYDDKMQKAYRYLEGDYQAIRAGRANPHVLLWDAYADPAGGQCDGAGAENAADCAMGENPDQGNRKSDHGFRRGDHAFQ